jgi:magnesium chelatase subunit I
VGVVVPPYMQLIIEEVVRLARNSPHVSQASGVSVRTSIANLEAAVSNAERRGILTGEERVAVRPCDLQHLIASSRGKVEMTLAEDDASEDKLLKTLIGEAIKNVFDAVAEPDDFETISEQFQGNLTFPANDELSAQEFIQNMDQVDGLTDGAKQIARGLKMDPDDPQVLAGAGELLLEGLYVHNRLSKLDTDGKSFFKR